MRRTLVTLGMLIFSFSFVFLNPNIVQGLSITLAEKIQFADNSKLQITPWSFCVTEEGLFLIPDYEDKYIKVFQKEGKYLKLVNKFGPKGFGSGRFNKAGYCFYNKDAGKFGVIDKKYIFIFEINSNMDFKLLEAIMVDCYDMKLWDKGKQLIISGYVTDKEKKAYDLYTINLEDKEQKRFLLTSPEKYQLSGIEYFFEYYVLFTIPPKGIRGFLDVQGDDAYFIWEGKLRIIKINLKTKERIEFGHRTGHYIEPFVSPKLREAYLKRESAKVKIERAKMSLIKYIFAAPQHVWVVYGAPRQGNLRMQKYTPEGVFLGELQIPGNLDQVLWLDKDNDTLYSLSKAGDKEQQLLIYRVGK